MKNLIGSKEFYCEITGSKIKSLNEGLLRLEVDVDGDISNIQIVHSKLRHSQDDTTFYRYMELTLFQNENGIFILLNHLTGDSSFANRTIAKNLYEVFLKLQSDYQTANSVE